LSFQVSRQEYPALDGKHAPHGPATSSPFWAGFRGRCPHCGEGRLFQGFLTLQPSCTECGLDYSFADSGDGPAVFIMLFVGFLMVGGVVVVDVAYEPPLWVHAVIWLPLTVLFSLGFLRPLKGLMIAMQYYHKAEQGRLEL
jgi:uncharacterized protein (DUF983 family)